MESGSVQTYRPKMANNGAYVFIINGCFEINGKTFSNRDGIGISSFDSISIKNLKTDGEILIMEIPMEIK